MSMGSGRGRLPARVLVVVPAFNEELVIAGSLDELLRRGPDVDVLVVDDGSTDTTAARARAAGVAVISLPFNIGVGGAMRVGFLYASRNQYDAVVQFDADGQHDPAYVQTLLSALGSADVVVGGRFGGPETFKVGRPRRLAMRLLAWAISAICGTKITDASSGFRASGPRALALFARYYPTEYLGDTVESLVVAHKAGLTVREVGVTMRPRAGGQPSQSMLKSSVYLARALLVLVLAVIRRYQGAPDLDPASDPAAPTPAQKATT
jgi:glycosyltransferase involved in cell wall biosynthesis